MQDFLLASFHHVAVFALVIALGAELVMVRAGLDAAAVARLGRLDAAYGGLAGLVLVAGLLRVVFGAAGWEYYVGNWVFWTKMGLFALVGLMSVVPTIAILGWRKRQAAEPGFVPDTTEVLRLRRLIHLEAVLLLLIPVAAAAMARGIGL
jgi:putative membrane protein